MKKLLALAAVLFASVASAQVSTTPHNMNTKIGGGSNEDVCRFCHVAHNGNGPAPLWGRNNSTQTLTFYTSGTISSTPLALDAVSAACMSCHDGVADVGALINNIDLSPAGTVVVSAVNAVGPSLTNDHPVSIAWTAGRAGLATAPVVGTLAADGTGAFVYLNGDTVTCATCHAVHNNTNGKFLRFNSASGGLCQRCHTTK